MPAQPTVDPRVAAVRRFNRFYTQRIGVLEDGYAGSRFSLTEARVLYELRRSERSTATAIGRELGLDAGYLSRMLRRFRKSGLIRKETSPQDARQSFLSLTIRGRKAFAPLEAESNRRVGAMLARLPAARQARLVSTLRTAEALLKDDTLSKPAIVLREPETGDLGWVVARHAVLYEQEFGWGGEFEGLCARIVADFSKNFDPSCERCWIAEADGEIAGSAFLVKDTEDVARLRLLLVEPFARGLGLGSRLTDECIAFARACGYRRITLWTHGVLAAARHTYAKAGFRLTSSEKRRSFGSDVVSEHWDLELSPPRART
ncbi:MAG: bifunctional helix-turn-helix transcriptional regulator/GNAT family N-acetyltransferase [Alphaproteobacteria bacterium]|nr:bifunctional helix-turn-helix transcriptional regulator/GNAT family N-acetyltransferase [Alphaproteobacteria bacterium]